MTNQLTNWGHAFNLVHTKCQLSGIKFKLGFPSQSILILLFPKFKLPLIGN